MRGNGTFQNLDGLGVILLTQNDFWSGVGWSAYQIFHVWYVFGACFELV